MAAARSKKAKRTPQKPLKERNEELLLSAQIALGNAIKIGLKTPPGVKTPRENYTVKDNPLQKQFDGLDKVLGNVPDDAKAPPPPPSHRLVQTVRDDMKVIGQLMEARTQYYLEGNEARVYQLTTEINAKSAEAAAHAKTVIDDLESKAPTIIPPPTAAAIAEIKKIQNNKLQAAMDEEQYKELKRYIDIQRQFYFQKLNPGDIQESKLWKRAGKDDPTAGIVAKWEAGEAAIKPLEPGLYIKAGEKYNISVSKDKQGSTVVRPQPPVNPLDEEAYKRAWRAVYAKMNLAARDKPIVMTGGARLLQSQEVSKVSNDRWFVKMIENNVRAQLAIAKELNVEFDAREYLQLLESKAKANNSWFGFTGEDFDKLQFDIDDHNQNIRRARQEKEDAAKKTATEKVKTENDYVAAGADLEAKAMIPKGLLGETSEQKRQRHLEEGMAAAIAKIGDKADVIEGELKTNVQDKIAAAKASAGPDGIKALEAELNRLKGEADKLPDELKAELKSIGNKIGLPEVSNQLALAQAKINQVQKNNGLVQMITLALMDRKQEVEYREQLVPPALAPPADAKAYNDVIHAELTDRSETLKTLINDRDQLEAEIRAFDANAGSVEQARSAIQAFDQRLKDLATKAESEHSVHGENKGIWNEIAVRKGFLLEAPTVNEDKKVERQFDRLDPEELRNRSDLRIFLDDKRNQMLVREKSQRVEAARAKVPFGAAGFVEANVAAEMKAEDAKRVADEQKAALADREAGVEKRRFGRR